MRKSGNKVESYDAKAQKEKELVPKSRKQDEKKKEPQTLTFNVVKVLGNGSFGVVYLVHVAETGEMRALKKVFQDPRYKNRELQIMHELNHPSCIKLLQSFSCPGESKNEVYLNLVMDFIPETAYRVMRGYQKMKEKMPMVLVKLYTYQLTRALAYIHQKGICHRDIKPQNLLINPQTFELKLCDFGSAKFLIKGEPNVSYICSRYYRAPELIFGASDYSTQIDVWAMGCVMAEYILGRPLFPGESGVDQLVEIIKILGTPNKEQILAMNPKYKEHRFPQIPPLPWTKVFGSRITDEAMDFLNKVLVYPPFERLKPMELLCHHFFDELRDPATRLPGNEKVPAFMFKFTPEEIQAAPELIEHLVPKWVR